MPQVFKTELPEEALLQRYRQTGSYTDCYISHVKCAVFFPDYVTAFYTTLLFRAERVVLSWFFSKPSTDHQARQLAQGAASTWAAWTVEDRTSNQLLMKDHQGRTRSWFMLKAVGDGAEGESQLYFGSAVLPLERRPSGEIVMGIGFRAIAGFHKLYSVALLMAAASKLCSQ